MGVNSSVLDEECVSIAHMEWLVNESFTVERTSGDKESGWFITTTMHKCSAIGAYTRVTAHAAKNSMAFKNPGVWRIFMRNAEDDPNTHACGWRRITTIAPTRLIGDDAAIIEWRHRVIEELQKAEDEENSRRVAVCSLQEAEDNAKYSGRCSCESCIEARDRFLNRAVSKKNEMSGKKVKMLQELPALMAE
jgi:hypothetical protein